MGRKSSSKQGPRPPAEALHDKKSKSPLVAIVAGVLAVAVVVAVMSRGGGTTTDSAGTPADSPAAQSAQQAASPEAVARAAETAAYGPHKQANLPPIPFQAYQPPRSHDVITAAYHFTAEHPEIASYVPCFCGCEQAGHDGNHACFVKSRAPNGDVLEWEPHGVDCAVCIDVATRSRQLHASGASVRDIRAAIEKEFKPHSPRMTPTPTPPGTSAENHAH
jgi:hypothetical protein